MTLNPTRSNVLHTCVTSIHEAQISLFRSTTSCFLVTGHLRKVHQMTPNDHYKLQCSPHVLIVSRSPKFHSVSLYDQPFLRYRAFWDKCTEWPPNDLDLTSSNVPHIFITIVPESQISLRFALRPAFFNIQAIWRQVHRMIPKWPWTLQGQRYPINVLLVSMCPKFHSVSLYDEPFSSYGPFWDKCTEWPQNNLEPYKFKCTLYIYNYCPWVPDFTPFRSTTSRFRVTGHFEKVHQMTAKWHRI